MENYFLSERIEEKARQQVTAGAAAPSKSGMTGAGTAYENFEESAAGARQEAARRARAAAAGQRSAAGKRRY